MNCDANQVGKFSNCADSVLFRNVLCSCGLSLIVRTFVRILKVTICYYTNVTFFSNRLFLKCKPFTRAYSISLQAETSG